jgi:hypothetical protein
MYEPPHAGAAAQAGGWTTQRNGRPVGAARWPPLTSRIRWPVPFRTTSHQIRRVTAHPKAEAPHSALLRTALYTDTRPHCL